jgi:hypothetical protein
MLENRLGQTGSDWRSVAHVCGHGREQRRQRGWSLENGRGNDKGF